MNDAWYFFRFLKETTYNMYAVAIGSKKRYHFRTIHSVPFNPNYWHIVTDGDTMHHLLLSKDNFPIMPNILDAFHLKGINIDFITEGKHFTSIKIGSIDLLEDAKQQNAFVSQVHKENIPSAKQSKYYPVKRKIINQKPQPAKQILKSRHYPYYQLTQREKSI